MSTLTDPSIIDMYQQGLTHYSAGDYQRSRDCAEVGLAVDPGNAACLTLKGMALNELGQSEEAVESLRRATEAAPDQPEPWQQLGIALMTVGDLEGAAAAFQSCLRVSPHGVSVLVDLGNVLFLLGRSSEAIAALERARESRAGDISILRNLAGLCVSAGHPERARAVLCEILDFQPGDIVSLCDVARLDLELSQYDRAIESFRALRRFDPDHELYAIHGMIMTEIRRENWRHALDLAIEATRLDRFELTTLFLTFLTGKLFGTTRGQVDGEELGDRFEAEHQEHRRSHAEAAEL